MPSGSSRSSKPKPSEVAAETKRVYTPMIRQQHPEWPIQSYQWAQPLAQVNFGPSPPNVSAPAFYVQAGDPVTLTLAWQMQAGAKIPFLCAANDKRPGGDWETGAHGYEERLCRRSTLAACLATPAPGYEHIDNYPIPSSGGIYSPNVAVFRGPHDRYDKLPVEEWQDLPVVSVPPTRWPKLKHSGTKYSFDDEREMVKEKMRGALSICAYYEYPYVVIGDFGLGNGSRNPPQELAELWREVFLWDPDLRGRFRGVSFVFEDEFQSTTQLILDDIAKKSKGGSGSSSSSSHHGHGHSSSSSKGKSKASSSSSSSGSASRGGPTDYDIFSRVFEPSEIARCQGRTDARYEFSTLLTS